MSALSDITMPGPSGRTYAVAAPAKPGSATSGPVTGIRGVGLAGAVALITLVGVLGGWAATTVISGAVVASGQTVVEGRSKIVQHQGGGIVASIAVQNGDVVEAGDLLVTLDPTVVALNLDTGRTRLAAALALRARLLAEQSGAETIDFTAPPLPEAVTARPLKTASHEAGQREIFAARAETLRGSRARLVETLSQLDQQIAGFQGQIDAADEQLGYLDAEITVQRSLVDQGLSRQSQMSELQRSRADLAGRRAAHLSEVARLEIAKRDAELVTLQEERALREEVVTTLREVTDEIDELTLQIVTQQAELDRMEIRAPAAGVVHELQITTVGGVVAPGETLLEIVPQGGAAEFEVRVTPASIDQVHPGQTAEIVLPGLDQRETPRLTAQVVTVSAAAIPDPQTGLSFYRVDLSVTPEEIARLPAGSALVPGMPVEAYLQTGDRTVLSYLMQPITSHLRHAFRE